MKRPTLPFLIKSWHLLMKVNGKKYVFWSSDTDVLTLLLDLVSHGRLGSQILNRQR